jgi:hypothetical protein
MWKVSEDEEVLKLNGTHEFLVYAPETNTIKRSIDSLLVASNEADLEVNVGNINSCVVSRIQDRIILQG